MSKKSIIYYKGLDDNLCGYNNFQYTVGETFEADTNDTCNWLHFSKYFQTAIGYGNRIVEVQPLTQVKFQTTWKYDDQSNAKRIKIVRELSREEILNKIIETKYPFEYLCMRGARFKLTFEDVKWLKKHNGIFIRSRPLPSRNPDRAIFNCCKYIFSDEDLYELVQA